MEERATPINSIPRRIFLIEICIASKDYSDKTRFDVAIVFMAIKLMVSYDKVIIF